MQRITGGEKSRCDAAQDIGGYVSVLGSGERVLVAVHHPHAAIRSFQCGKGNAPLHVRNFVFRVEVATQAVCSVIGCLAAHNFRAQGRCGCWCWSRCRSGCWCWSRCRCWRRSWCRRRCGSRSRSRCGSRSRSRCGGCLFCPGCVASTSAAAQQQGAGQPDGRRPKPHGYKVFVHHHSLQVVVRHHGCAVWHVWKHRTSRHAVSQSHARFAGSLGAIQSNRAKPCRHCRGERSWRDRLQPALTSVTV